MKKITVCAVLFTASFMGFAQVGIDTSTPEGVLDVVSTNSGLIPPRVANTAAVTTPVDGMLVYDMSSTCAKVYENGAWTDCLSFGAVGSLVADCDQNGFEGSYTAGVPTDATNDFTITITNNNPYSVLAISFDPTDLVLSGEALGSLSVASVTPTTVNLAVGASQVVNYQLSGTPDAGTLQADWSKLSISCTKTTMSL